MAYIGNQLTSTSFMVDVFSGTGSQTAFVGLTFAPASTAAIAVYVAGVYQSPTSYSLSGTTLNFNSAPAAGTSNIQVLHLGTGAIAGVPSDGSVTTAKIADNSVTNDKVSFTYSSNNFTANGTGNTYTVTTGHTANSVMVAYNGVLLVPILDYDISSTTLTLTFTPTANSNVSVRYLPV